ncbi:MAG TPA: carboxypeptidase-like regulatory domain-containing protein [Prolixibacteraceae bacterium]|nr:carboxypeptidase-like regulatory domain-containing protein [Prolixibacteraceae bacterium]
MKTQTLLLFLLFLFVSTLVYSGDYLTLSGIVRDVETGKVLQGADIFIKGLNTGTLSNEAGEFFLFLLPGTYEMTVSSKGYQTRDIMLELTEDLFFEVPVTPEKQGNKSSLWMKLKMDVPEVKARKEEKMPNPV